MGRGLEPSRRGNIRQPLEPSAVDNGFRGIGSKPEVSLLSPPGDMVASGAGGFLVSAFGELLLISLFAPAQPWLWMILLAMPIVGWFLENEKRHQQRSIRVLVEEIAGQLNLQKYRFEEKTGREEKDS